MKKTKTMKKIGFLSKHLPHISTPAKSRGHPEDQPKDSLKYKHKDKYKDKDGDKYNDKYRLFV